MWGDVIVGVVVGALSKAAGGDESAFSIGSRLLKPRAKYNVRERSNVEETASARATYLGRVQAARWSLGSLEEGGRLSDRQYTVKAKSKVNS